MRIGIIALLQESNTFIAQPTRLEHFQQELLVTGEAVRERLAGTHHEVGGMFHVLEEEREEAVPIFAARALPFGVVEEAAIERLLEMMFAALESAGPLDGVLVAPHGATVSEPWPDVDGHWLTELRRRIGWGKPIIGTLDPHANLSPAMVAACDALVAYRTNPHLDQRARGIDAARLMVRTARGEIRPTMAAAYPPLTINIERQHTAEEPLHSLYRLADEQLIDERVRTNSILLGFPYADVPEMGSAALVVTDNEPRLARRLADDLAGYMWEHRDKFVGEFIGIDAALDKAAGWAGPVCLLDMGDNVGGGSPGDGTLLAQAIHARKLPKALAVLYDPESVALAEAIGEWGTGLFRVGGKSDDRHGSPLACEATVQGLFDGPFEEPHPRHGGIKSYDQGRSAVVRTDTGLTILVNSRRTPPFSLRQLTSCGLNPADFHLLVVKGVNAPLAAYKEVCKHFIRVNTPGCTTADLSQLNYQRRRRPMFPFEGECSWSREEESSDLETRNSQR
jgi:microcystin degradation protein MlrC